MMNDPNKRSSLYLSVALKQLSSNQLIKFLTLHEKINEIKDTLNTPVAAVDVAC